MGLFKKQSHWTHEPAAFFSGLNAFRGRTIFFDFSSLFTKSEKGIIETVDIIVTRRFKDVGQVADNIDQFSCRFKPVNCHYGGVRWRAICYNLKGNGYCKNLVDKLYWFNGELVCRSCANLRYKSQNLDKRSSGYRYKRILNLQTKISHQESLIVKRKYRDVYTKKYIQINKKVLELFNLQEKYRWDEIEYGSLYAKHQCEGLRNFEKRQTEKYLLEVNKT